VRNLAREGRLPIRKKTRPQEKPFINMLALIKEADGQFAAEYPYPKS
jgi:hypothetical protein